MLSYTLNEIREARAKFIRDAEYAKETALDDIIDSRVEIAESVFEKETIDELMEAAELVDRLPDEEDLVAEAAEVSRILEAEKDITFEEMVGV